MDIEQVKTVLMLDPASNQGQNLIAEHIIHVLQTMQDRELAEATAMEITGGILTMDECWKKIIAVAESQAPKHRVGNIAAVPLHPDFVDQKAREYFCIDAQYSGTVTSSAPQVSALPSFEDLFGDAL